MTRFAGLSRGHALLIVSATLAAGGWCLVAALSPKKSEQSTAANGSDLRLYRTIVEHVRAGEDYYEAAGHELRAVGYPTGSIFNWRPPLYAWVFSLFPTLVWAQAVVAMFAALALILSSTVLYRDGGIGWAVAGLFPLIGALHWSIDGDAFLSQEFCSGMLITLSVCAYAYARWRAGLAIGLLALFFRELALPYCLIALVLARRERRRAEIVAWLFGLTLYAIYMMVHITAVARQILPDDRMPASWLQFGGPAFLLLTCRMNAYLFNAPLWLSALYLPLALLGLSAWSGAIGMRLGLTASAYVAAFAVVGQPFNDYWGLMYAPLLSFGFAAAPAAIRELVTAIRNTHDDAALLATTSGPFSGT
jgi:hypothetical protein